MSNPSAQPLDHDRLSPRKRRLKKVLLWTSVAFAIVLAAIAAFGFFVVAPLLGIRDEASFSETPATAICTQIVGGTLKPDANGIVKLPPADANLSLDGQACSFTDKSGVVWILFKTWRGKGANMHGYLYSSAPISASMPAQINALVPTLHSSSSTAPPTQQMDLDVRRMMPPHWYEVSFDLD